MLTIVEQEIAPEILTERERRARVLEAAALEIEVRGWCKVHGQNKAGNVCLIGAVGCVLGAKPLDAYVDASDEWHGRLTGLSDIRVLWLFNDMHARDAHDVTFVLRWRAAEIRDGR